MDRFIRCVCDNDLTALIKTGTADQESLNRAWLIILSEYHELKSDDAEASQHWKLTCKIVRLHHCLVLIQHCIDYLSHTYSESLKNSLKRLGYSIKTVSQNPEDYKKDLYIIVNKAKTKYVELQQLTKQLDELLKKTDTIKQSKTVFDGMLICFEEMQHTTYTLDTVTVSKFIMLEKKYNDYINRLEQKAKRYGSYATY